MLSLVVWLPVLGAILIGILPSFSRSIALAISGSTLAGSLAIAGMFNYEDSVYNLSSILLGSNH